MRVFSLDGKNASNRSPTTCYALAEPSGTTNGHVMRTLGDRPAADVTPPAGDESRSCSSEAEDTTGRPDHV
jgi:hypothetical protein